MDKPSLGEKNEYMIELKYIFKKLFDEGFLSEKEYAQCLLKIEEESR